MPITPRLITLCDDMLIGGKLGASLILLDFSFYALSAAIERMSWEIPIYVVFYSLWLILFDDCDSFDIPIESRWSLGRIDYSNLWLSVSGFACGDAFWARPSIKDTSRSSCRLQVILPGALFFLRRLLSLYCVSFFLLRLAWLPIYGSLSLLWTLTLTFACLLIWTV